MKDLQVINNKIMTKNGAGFDPSIEDVPTNLGDRDPRMNEGIPAEKIIVAFSESDLQELMNGDEMTWRFPLEEGREVELLLRLEREEDMVV